jgi:ferredoxin
MIVSYQKPMEEILAALANDDKIFLIGCAKCATVCKAGGEEEVWQMQEILAAAGKEITGSMVIDEACHMLRSGRDLRAKKEMVEEADALLVLACGAGIQSISAGTPKKTVAGLNTLFLGNIRRFGQFEQKCSLCGECLLTETGCICPVTLCPKGLLNGPCGGMDHGRCETDKERECVWLQIFERLQGRGALDNLKKIVPEKDFSRMLKPGNLKLEKETAR